MDNREYLDFEIINEPWNTYQLSDGTILKTRTILKSIIKVKVGNKIKYELDIQDLSVIQPPSYLMGTPDSQTYTTEDLSKNVINDIDYTTSHEEWNNYKTASIRIKLKSSVAIVKKTNKRDSKGNPIYLFDNTVIPLISNSKGELQNITENQQ